MNNFKIIYRILKYLEQSMDNEIFEISPISAEQLGISRERWAALLCLLQDEGYISGLIFTQTMSDSKPLLMEPVRPSKVMEVNWAIIRSLSCSAVMSGVLRS